MTIRVGKKSPALFGISVMAAATLVAVPGSASAVTIVDLGTLPGGEFSVAEDINDAGTVVGLSHVGTGGSHAVRWDDGVITDLGTLPGDRSSGAVAINDRGEIIGTSDNMPVRWSSTGVITELARLAGDEVVGVRDIGNTGTAVGFSSNVIPIGTDAEIEQHAVRWNAAGVPTALPVPPGTTDSIATAISDDGVIVGQVSITGQGGHAVRWNTDGTVTDLGGLPGGTTAEALGVNDAGAIFGWAQADPEPHFRAVRWSAQGVITALPLLPGGNSGSVATAINGSGVVTGHSSAPVSSHAVRWSPDGSVTDLGLLPGHNRTFASGINDAGVIVGDSEDFNDTSSQRAVRWDPDGTITNLGVLPGGNGSSAKGINDSGVIFGSSGLANGDFHAVIWR